MSKNLLPTLKEKSRYLAFNAIYDGELNKKDVSKSITQSILRFFGEQGLSRMNLWFIEWDAEKKTGIAKVERNSLDMLRTGFVLTREINGRPTLFHTLNVSGTLKALREKNLT